MKQLLCMLIALFMSFPAFSQMARILGKVVDQGGEGLPGAHILLTDNFGAEIQATVTDVHGEFKLEALMNERYKIKVTFLGFEELEQHVLTNSPLSNLGLIRLKKSSIDLNEVEVKEKIPIATQQEDTLSFNADAFKTLPDASAEDLVEKMPTVVIEDGKVQAQGEDVERVLVDGRPFFGNDPTAALRNLPAEVVDKIQIFDQASDQAQFTGFDDGETIKTMNIITRLKMRNGQFGKVYGGYGYDLQSDADNDGKYKAGGSLNFFDGDRRISVIGLSNNINQQNFATEDLLGVVGSSGRRGRGGFGGRGGGPRGGSRGGGGGQRGGRGGGGASVSDFLVGQQGGIATTHALGINYSDKWGKQFDISGSYFFNTSENESLEALNREFIDISDASEAYSEFNNSVADNYNHRLNFKIEYQIDSANSIIMRPRLSIQDNNGLSNTFGQTFLGDILWNQTDNAYDSELSGLNFSNNLLFRHRFNKRRRTFSVGFNTTYNDKTGRSLLNSEDLFFSDDTMELLDQLSDLGIEGWNLSTNLAYTEPVGKRGMLMLNYRLSWQIDDSDKKTFDFDEDSGGYDEVNNALSNVFSNNFVTNEAGAGYNYRKGDLVLMARGSVQWAQLDNEQTFPVVTETGNTFTSVLPFLMLRYNFSRMSNLRIFYRTNTRLPTVEQLQNVIDNSNPLQLSVGNPDLRQQYQQNVMLRYSATNVDKSTVFFTMFGGGYTNNYIANSLYLTGNDHPIFAELSLDPGSQLSQPVNLDGYWNLRSFSTFGVPLKQLKSNLNINLTGNYARIPGLINGELNYSNNTTLGTGLVLSSNISETVDFTISSRSTYNIVENSLQSAVNSNYFQQNSRLKFNWILGETTVIRTDFTHQYYQGLTDDFDQSFFVWNASIGRKVFKNKRGEIALAIYDLLDQNNRISRIVTETYIEDTQTNILQRFVMLNFTYNLRNFHSKK